MCCSADEVPRARSSKLAAHCVRFVPGLEPPVRRRQRRGQRRDRLADTSWTSAADICPSAASLVACTSSSSASRRFCSVRCGGRSISSSACSSRVRSARPLLSPAARSARILDADELAIALQEDVGSAARDDEADKHHDQQQRALAASTSEAAEKGRAAMQRQPSSPNCDCSRNMKSSLLDQRPATLRRIGFDALEQRRRAVRSTPSNWLGPRDELVERLRRQRREGRYFQSARLDRKTTPVRSITSAKLDPDFQAPMRRLDGGHRARP